MVSTSSHVVVAARAHVHVVDTETKAVKTFETAVELSSPPLADRDGNIYWSDAGNVFSIDAAMKERWTTSLGSFHAMGEFLSPGPMLLDGMGNLYAVGLGSRLLALDTNTGAIIDSVGLDSEMNLLSVGTTGAIFYHDALGRLRLASLTSKLVERVEDPTGWSPGWGILGGGDIGLVTAGYVNPQLGTSRTVVLDECGRLRWTVPQSFSLPIAITYDGDLIVQDGQGNGTRDLRRFDADGHLLAGPVSLDRPVATSVGADDVLHVITCRSDHAKLVALGPDLQEKNAVDLGAGGCPAAAVLGPSGILYYVREGTPGELSAIQTTSPGPGRVSWSQPGGNASATAWIGTVP
jgi:outer membrane protein assembly factor BamB